MVLSITSFIFQKGVGFDLLRLGNQKKIIEQEHVTIMRTNTLKIEKKIKYIIITPVPRTFILKVITIEEKKEEECCCKDDEPETIILIY